MVTVEQKVSSLRAQVAAAREEFDLAVAFHGVWRPAAYDEDLLKRMGPSYASNAFLVIRTALHREMLLALMRLWDRDRNAVRLTSIRDILKDQRVIEALADEAAARMSGSAGLANDISSALKGPAMESIGKRAAEAADLIDRYSSETEAKLALGNLKLLRDKVLAHRQVKHVEIPEKTATGEQIEHIMADMSKLIGHLSSIAHATAYDPQDTSEIYDRYAELFWAPVRGERTEGHPNFRHPPSRAS